MLGGTCAISTAFGARKNANSGFRAFRAGLRDSAAMQTPEAPRSDDEPTDRALWLWDDQHAQWVLWLAEQWAETQPGVQPAGDDE